MAGLVNILMGKAHETGAENEAGFAESRAGFQNLEQHFELWGRQWTLGAGTVGKRNMREKKENIELLVRRSEKVVCATFIPICHICIMICTAILENSYLFNYCPMWGQHLGYPTLNCPIWSP